MGESIWLSVYRLYQIKDDCNKNDNTNSITLSSNMFLLREYREQVDDDLNKFLIGFILTSEYTNCQIARLKSNQYVK